MSASTAIYGILSNDANVSALVSTRIYPEFAPQEATLPCIVYNIGGLEQQETKDSPNKVDVWEVMVRYYDNNPDDTDTLAALGRTALSRYKGTIGGEEVDTIQLMDVEREFIEADREFLVMQEWRLRLKN